MALARRVEFAPVATKVLLSKMLPVPLKVVRELKLRAAPFCARAVKLLLARLMVVRLARESVEEEPSTWKVPLAVEVE